MKTQNSFSDEAFFYIEIDPKNTFAELSFEGEVTKKLLNDSLVQLMNHNNFKRNMNACYDYSKGCFDVPVVDIKAHAKFVSEHYPQRGSQYKLAMVSSDPYAYALLAVYKILIANNDVKTEVFSRKSQAINWLTYSETS